MMTRLYYRRNRKMYKEHVYTPFILSPRVSKYVINRSILQVFTATVVEHLLCSVLVLNGIVLSRYPLMDNQAVEDTQ
jgi:hypothetical protein